MTKIYKHKLEFHCRRSWFVQFVSLNLITHGVSPTLYFTNRVINSIHWTLKLMKLVLHTHTHSTLLLSGRGLHLEGLMLCTAEKKIFWSPTRLTWFHLCTAGNMNALQRCQQVIILYVQASQRFYAACLRWVSSVVIATQISRLFYMAQILKRYSV